MRSVAAAVLCIAVSTSIAFAEDFAEIVKSVRDSVVRIEVSGPKGESLGSGFVIREDGIIATNFHVIDDAAKGKVVFEDGRSLDIAGMLVERSGHDMVLLKTVTNEKLTALPLCERLPEQGEDVFTFGNPKGLRFVVSRGIVSAIADTAELMTSDDKLARELKGSYSPDATWIQTDAPISGGNSGGPLINMKGEVVGINTWNRTDGQNLNFAGSAQTLRKMLKVATDTPMPLPMARPGMNQASIAPAPDFPKLATRDRISLPTNKTLDFGIFSKSATLLSDSDRAQMQAAGAFSIEYPSGKPFALLQHNSGKLHGLCCAQHENGNAMLIGRYVKGERTGNFRMASDDGQPLLDAQYVGDDKDGFTCFYGDGSPVLVQECSKGKPAWSHRLEEYAVVESLDHKAGDPEKVSEKMKAALSSLTDFEKKLKMNEVKVKKLVKELEDDIRKQRAAVRGAYSQQMIQQRINSRAAENAAVIGALKATAGY
jgi:hypothetical protein